MICVGRPKLTEEMVQQAIRLKADGLSNGDIICALGVHESTFYRWIGEPKNKLQRELCEGLKKEEAEFKHTLLTTIRAAALSRNQYWTAAAWLLERKYPDEYGKADRQRNDSDGEAAPKIVLGVVAQPVQERIDFGGVDSSGKGDGSDAVTSLRGDGAGLGCLAGVDASAPECGKAVDGGMAAGGVGDGA